MEEFNEVKKDLLDKLPNDIAMITKVWGPPTWFFLHSMAMSYPKKIDENNAEHLQKRNSMYSFLINLGDILPCPICGTSYTSYIREPELSVWEHLDSRANLIEFIYKIHNRVNEKLGVPKCDIPSFKSVVEYYSKFIAGPCKATTDYERQQRMLQGCNADDIEHGKFKDFKCDVNIINKNDNKGVKIIENFGNGNDVNSLLLTSGLIGIIITTIIIALIIIRKK